MSPMNQGNTQATVYPDGSCIGQASNRQVLGFLVGRTLAQSLDRGAGWLQQPQRAKTKARKKTRSMEFDVHL